MTDRTEHLQQALEGRYVIERVLGEGGMAVVYLAKDLKHDRPVALKVLRPELAAVIGADRFLAEIATTAKLQHPHILPLFDSGQADGFLFYVMPFVEGESLRDRLNRERQLPVDEAISIVTKVAGALQAAHDSGVIHRDIKPGNILISKGEPLVADFGVAFAVDAGAGDRLTETGLSVGTPHYMSPEQASGSEPVGFSTDIYALGCVLYEALVGAPPFEGTTVHGVLRKVLTADPPPASGQRSTVPPNVDGAIGTALEKIPADRFRSARDFSNALADTGYRQARQSVPAVGSEARTGPGHLLVGASVIFGIVALAVAGWALRDTESALPTFTVPVSFPDDQALAGTGHFDLSDDGSVLVYQGVGQFGQTQLWVRRADEVRATPIAGSEGLSPGIVPDIAISPSGEEVAFYRSGAFHVLPVTGGTARAVTDSIWGTARWSPDGEWIYLRRLPAPGLSRVSAAGGIPEVVTQIDTARGETGHVWPDVLPGGDVVLFEAMSPRGSRIKAVRLSNGEVTDIGPGRYPRYASGRLLFASEDGTRLVSAPFDTDELRFEGDAETLLGGLRGLGAPGFGAVGYAVSSAGVLAYAPMQRWKMERLSRDGARRAVDPAWQIDPGDAPQVGALSPDGSRIALRLIDPDGSDLWLKELETGPMTRVTSRPGTELPLGWLDGDRLLYLADGESGSDLWSARADGTGEPTLVFDHATGISSASITSDGRWLVFSSTVTHYDAGGPVGGETFTVDLSTESVAQVRIPTPGHATGEVTLSPDDRLLAFVSSATGRAEVMLRTFPDMDAGRVQVSVAGGTSPRWAPDGSRLYYVNQDHTLMEAEVTSRAPLRVSRRALFALEAGQGRDIEVTPSGDFLALRSNPELVLVFNWLSLVQ